MNRLMLAPWIVAMRWPDMVLSATHPTASRRRENQRMVTEKAQATYDGLAAAMRTSALLTFEMSTTWWKPWSPKRIMNAQASIVEAALTPAARVVGANARRLVRRTRR